MTTSTPVDPAVTKTHEAIFDNYFPIDLVPANLRPQIAATAKSVSAALLAAITQRPEMGTLREYLEMLATPTKLPDWVYASLDSGIPVVKTFLDSGFGGLRADDRDLLWVCSSRPFPG